MSCPVCSKRRLVEINVNVGEKRITMHHCSACTARWWDADGERVQLPEILELATVRR
jgi:transcription elongation factor Elf1